MFGGKQSKHRNMVMAASSCEEVFSKAGTGKLARVHTGILLENLLEATKYLKLEQS